MSAVMTTMKDAIEEGVVGSISVLSGEASTSLETPLHTRNFVNGFATAPAALARKGFGLLATLVVPPVSVAVTHLPGGEQRLFQPGSYTLWDVKPGMVLVQWVDMRRQQVRVGPIEGLSADKWRVRLWLVAEVEVDDPVCIAAHREPLSALLAALRTGALRYIEQHSHADLTGCSGDQGGLDAPALIIQERLKDDAGLVGLHVIRVRVLERQGDERQIEAATAATVQAAQIDEQLRIAAARQRAQLAELESQAVLAEREHALRLSEAAAVAREKLLLQQNEVQQAALAARLEIALAQIRAQAAEIARDEQQWQAEQVRLQNEWDLLQKQQLEVHRTDQQLRLMDAQHGMLHTEGELALDAEERRNSHALALAEIQQHLTEQRTLQSQAQSERRIQHEQTLLELHLRHEQLVAQQMQQLEQWRFQQIQVGVQHQQQHERQMAVIAGTAQVAAAAAALPDDLEVSDIDRHEVADLGLRSLQAMAG